MAVLSHAPAFSLALAQLAGHLEQTLFWSQPEKSYDRYTCVGQSQESVRHLDRKNTEWFYHLAERDIPSFSRPAPKNS
jgi:hypothetical protein